MRFIQRVDRPSQPSPALAWTVLIVVGVWIAILLAGNQARVERETACRAAGGTLVIQHPTTSCVRGGKIIILWMNGQRVDNP